LRSDGAVRPRHVPGLGVTLLAEPRLRQPEHGVVVRAVRVVAVRAALEYGLMVPQEGAPLFRVAGEAVVVQRVFLEQRRRDRAVRIVARGAGHLPLAHRHVRAPHRLRALLQMTGAAGLDLVVLGELMLRRDVLHQRVAVGTGHIARLVTAPLPEDPGPLGMALEAHGVALFHRRGIVPGEGDEPALALAAPRLHMRLTGTVAVLAGVLLARGARLEEEEAPHPGLGELV